MTFDQALSALLPLVGQQIEAHVLMSGDVPIVVATVRGKLLSGLPLGVEDADEAVLLQIDTGGRPAAINLERESFTGARQDEDGLTIQFGAATVLVAPLSAP